MDDGTRRQKFNPAKGQIDRIKTLSLRKPLIGEPPWRRLASRGDFRALPFLPKTTTTTMTSLYELPLNTLSGEPVTLAAYRGQVLLIVNVASKCGLTPQYEGLERLHETYGERGLRVLGFPCNDFLGQEPGDAGEIRAFCTSHYGVRFPMFEKVQINTPDRHPLYRLLITAQPKATGGGALRERLAQKNLAPPAESDVTWNFEKFLVGRDGQVLARFAPDVAPEDSSLIATIESALS